MDTEAQAEDPVLPRPKGSHVRARGQRRVQPHRRSSSGCARCRACGAGATSRFRTGRRRSASITSSPKTGSGQTLHIHLEEYAPGAKSQKHGHVNEAVFYILDGEGAEVHDGVRYEWEAGDVAIVHNNCVHQHFNRNPDKPARALVLKTKPMYVFMNMLFQKTIEKRPTRADASTVPASSPREEPHDHDHDHDVDDHDHEHEHASRAERARASRGASTRRGCKATQTGTLLRRSARRRATKPAARRGAPQDRQSRGAAVGKLAARPAQAHRERGDEHARRNGRRVHADHPAGQPSGKHRQLAEQAFYVLEGRGYDVHVDCDLDIAERREVHLGARKTRRSASSGKPATSSTSRRTRSASTSTPTRRAPARIVVITNRIYKQSGLNDLEQLENAPEYDPNERLTAERVAPLSGGPGARLVQFSIANYAEARRKRTPHARRPRDAGRRAVPPLLAAGAAERGAAGAATARRCACACSAKISSRSATPTARSASSTRSARTAARRCSSAATKSAVCAASITAGSSTSTAVRRHAVGAAGLAVQRQGHDRRLSDAGKAAA